MLFAIMQNDESYISFETKPVYISTLPVNKFILSLKLEKKKMDTEKSTNHFLEMYHCTVSGGQSTQLHYLNESIATTGPILQPYNYRVPTPFPRSNSSTFEAFSRFISSCSSNLWLWQIKYLYTVEEVI